MNNLLKNISKEDYEKITSNLSKLLIKRLNLYTGQFNSAIPIQLVKNLNEHNNFILKLYLEKFSKDEILELMLKNDFDYLYSKGEEVLDNIINKTKLFYNVVILNNLVSNNNYYYNSTIKEGIKAFFNIYNKSYNAHEIKITVDYNTIIRPDLKGILFINKYLEYLNYENIFCNKFKNIERLLHNIYYNYEELPINIFEQVLTVSLLLELQKEDIYNLDINKIKINKKINSNELKEAYYSLLKKLNLNDKTKNYLDEVINPIITRIVNDINNNNLFKKNNIIKYYSNKKMTNEEFIDMLKNKDFNKVNSILDLIDLIDQNVFNKEELSKLFKTLTLIELIVLKNNLKETELLNEFLLKSSYNKKVIDNTLVEIIIK